MRRANGVEYRVESRKLDGKGGGVIPKRLGDAKTTKRKTKWVGRIARNQSTRRENEVRVKGICDGEKRNRVAYDG